MNVSMNMQQPKTSHFWWFTFCGLLVRMQWWYVRMSLECISIYTTPVTILHVWWDFRYIHNVCCANCHLTNYRFIGMSDSLMPTAHQDQVVHRTASAWNHAMASCRCPWSWTMLHVTNLRRHGASVGRKSNHPHVRKICLGRCTVAPKTVTQNDLLLSSRRNIESRLQHEFAHTFHICHWNRRTSRSFQARNHPAGRHSGNRWCTHEVRTSHLFWTLA